MLAYEDIVRPMRLHKDVEFTDVWNFMSVRPFKGKHPAEKPQDLLMHIIEASSYPGDIVLDCFAGSGSTGVAAVRLRRRTICMEIVEKWVKRAAHEITQAHLDLKQANPRQGPVGSGADRCRSGGKNAAMTGCCCLGGRDEAFAGSPK